MLDLTKEQRDAIQALREMQDDWDDEGAKKPLKECIDALETFLREDVPIFHDAPPYTDFSIEAGVDGSCQLYCMGTKQYLSDKPHPVEQWSIQFEPKGGMRAYYKRGAIDA